MTDLTMLLDHLSEVTRAATPGPWRWTGDIANGEARSLESRHKDHLLDEVLLGCAGAAYSETSEDPPYIEVSWENATFIARTDSEVVEALIDVARAAEYFDVQDIEAALDRLTAVLRERFGA